MFLAGERMAIIGTYADAEADVLLVCEEGVVVGVIGPSKGVVVTVSEEGSTSTV